MTAMPECQIKALLCPMEAVVVTCYGDEASDGKQVDVFLVASIFADKEVWDSLEPEWVERTQGIPFHATDCEAGGGAYRGWSREDRTSLSLDLANMLASRPIGGLCYGVHLRAAHECFPGYPSTLPYQSCFTKLIDALAFRAASLEMMNNLEIIFDLRKDCHYNAGLLYDDYVNSGQNPEAIFLPPTVSFTSRKLVGLQAADLWAFEMKRSFMRLCFDSKEFARWQMQALGKTGRFAAAFLDAEYFESLKRDFDFYAAQSGVSREDFHGWMSARNCQLNQTRLIEYFIETGKRLKHDETEI